MTFDEDGYPDKETVSTIENWQFHKNLSNLPDFIQLIYDHWEYPDYFRYIHETGYLQLSTAGWSGNEYLIHAMQKNRFFWNIFWYSSMRGGHYTFILFQFANDGKTRIMPELPFLVREWKTEV